MGRFETKGGESRKGKRKLGKVGKWEMREGKVVTKRNKHPAVESRAVFPYQSFPFFPSH